MSATARQPRPITLSALPRGVNLRLYAGDTFAMTVRVAEPSGAPIDLDGQTLEAQIRQIPESEVILGRFDTQTIDDLVVLQLSGELTARLPSRCSYDLQWTDRELTLIAGVIAMRPQVTRDD